MKNHSNINIHIWLNISNHSNITIHDHFWSVHNVLSFSVGLWVQKLRQCHENILYQRNLCTSVKTTQGIGYTWSEKKFSWKYNLHWVLRCCVHPYPLWPWNKVNVMWRFRSAQVDLYMGRSSKSGKTSPVSGGEKMLSVVECEHSSFVLRERRSK